MSAVIPTFVLRESSDGWLLTVTLSRAAIDQLAAALPRGRVVFAPGQVSMSISPNLVPCEPFDLNAVQVVPTDDAGAPAVVLERDDG